MFDGSQLLRSFPQVSKKVGNPCQCPTSPIMFAMHAGNGHRRTSGMTGLPADGMQQQRSAGDRLTMMERVGQADEQIPPV